MERMGLQARPPMRMVREKAAPVPPDFAAEGRAPAAYIFSATVGRQSGRRRSEERRGEAGAQRLVPVEDFESRAKFYLVPRGLEPIRLPGNFTKRCSIQEPPTQLPTQRVPPLN